MFCDVFGLDINKDLWYELIFLFEYGKWIIRLYIDMNWNFSYVWFYVMLFFICYIEGYVFGVCKVVKGSMGDYFK